MATFASSFSHSQFRARREQAATGGRVMDQHGEVDEDDVRPFKVGIAGFEVVCTLEETYAVRTPFKRVSWLNVLPEGVQVSCGRPD